MDLIRGLLLLFCFITGVLTETICELTYKVWGTSVTAQFVCSGCCCGEATTRYCCTCWWVYLIGPICGLVCLVTIAIIVVIVYKKKKRGHQGRVLPQGQVLQQPMYSQTMTVGGPGAPPVYQAPPPGYIPTEPKEQGSLNQ